MQQAPTDTSPRGRAPRAKRPLPLRVLRWGGVAGCVAAILLAAAYVFCEVRGEAIIRHVLEGLITETGSQITVRSAEIRFLPRPIIFAEDIAVARDGVSVRAAFASLRPSLARLVRGSYLPREVHLLRPRVEGALPVPFTDVGQGGPAAPVDGLDLSFLKGRCRLVIEDCDGRLMDSTGASIDVRHLSTTLTLTPAGTRVDGELAADFIVYHAVPSDSRERELVMADIESARRAAAPLPETGRPAGGTASGDATVPREEPRRHRARVPFSSPAIGLHRVFAEGGCDLSAFTRTVKMKLHAETRIPFLEARLRTDLGFTGGSAGLTILGNIDGAYRFDGQEIPFNLRGLCQPLAEAGELVYRDRLDTEGGAHISLQNLSMGQDNAGLDAVLAMDGSGPVLTGRLSLTHLSLTRWLTFARWLTPGLQEALDHVTEGIIDFRMDTKGLYCPFLSAEARGSLFTGRGGIADWKAPVVFLDMKSDFVDLGHAIPESVGRPVQAPPYLHRPLTELSVDELLENSRLRRLRWFKVNNPRVYRRIIENERAAGIPLPPGLDDDAPATTPERAAEQAREEERDGGGAGAAGAAPGAPAGAGAPGEKGEPGPGLGYDINLKADTIRYGLFTFTNGGVAITPSRQRDENGETLTSLAAATDLYGGTLTGECLMGGPHGEPTYDITLEAKGVNASALRGDFAPLPIAAGTISNRLSVKSHSLDIPEFLASITGRIEGRVSDCVLAAPGGKTGLSLSSLSLSLDLKKAAWDDGRLGLSGSWNVRGSGAWHPAATVQGMVWFGGDSDAGASFRDLPVTLEVRNLENVAPGVAGRDVTLSLKGRSTLKTSTPLLGFEKARLTVPGLSAGGSVTLRRRNGEWTAAGEAVGVKVSLDKLLPAFLGRMPDIPKQLRDFSGSAHVSAGAGKVALTRLSTGVDGHTVTGRIAATLDQVPELSFDLKLDAIDLDKYLGTAKPAAGAGRQAKTSAGRGKTAAAADDPGSPIDLTFLTTFNGAGVLRAGSVRYDGLEFIGVVLPMTLRGGQMEYSDLTAGFYGGKLRGSGSLDFREGLGFECESGARGLDFGALMRAKASKNVFIGKADFSTYLKGRLRTTKRVTQALDGHIGFSTGPLHYQAVNAKGRNAGRPILFTSTRGSGVLSAGVISTRDFALRSKKIDINGKGTVDLNDSTLDLRLDVDMRGLPIVPVRVHGDFSDPRTQVSLLGAIANIFRTSKDEPAEGHQEERR